MAKNKAPQRKSITLKASRARKIEPISKTRVSIGKWEAKLVRLNLKTKQQEMLDVLDLEDESIQKMKDFSCGCSLDELEWISELNQFVQVSKEYALKVFFKHLTTKERAAIGAV